MSSKSTRQSKGFSPTPRLIGGAVIILLGITMLLRLFDILPSFTFLIHDGGSILLILLGILLGLRTRFRNIGAYVLMLIGLSRLMDPFVLFGVPSQQLVWPLLLISIGAVLIFRRQKPKKKNYSSSKRDYARYKNRIENSGEEPVINDDTSINIDVNFGGRKEIITSKSFTGGQIHASFAGAEVNLVQADGPVQPMLLDIRISFGSLELIVPSHWEIKNEITPTMGSVEDQRSINTAPTAGTELRVLILRGSCTCGSIEIKSY